MSSRNYTGHSDLVFTIDRKNDVLVSGGVDETAIIYQVGNP
jgi:hypothetical protein